MKNKREQIEIAGGLWMIVLEIQDTDIAGTWWSLCVFSFESLDFK